MLMNDLYKNYLADAKLLKSIFSLILGWGCDPCPSLLLLFSDSSCLARAAAATFS